MTHSLPILLTMGDPAGCGPQITGLAWRSRVEKNLTPFAVVSAPDVYRGYAPVVSIDDPSETDEAFSLGLPVLTPPGFNIGSYATGTPSAPTALAIIESIRWATQATIDGKARAVVTNPISKAVLYDAGFKHPGHTEFIANICKDPTEWPDVNPIMMLVGGGLKVALATIHVPLSEAISSVTQERLISVAITVHTALKTDFGIVSPKIAFSGLNPHAGENGSIGREEIETINPAADLLRRNGINVSDARPADTVFHEALSGQFDAVIAMTHDQGLIPVKTLDMWGGVNTTLGLPIVRTSPDHGTAYDAAKTGSCRPDSLIAAIRLASSIAEHRLKASNE